MSEERLEIIEKLAHREGDEVLIEVCRYARKLQARVAILASDARKREEALNAYRRNHNRACTEV